MFEKRNGAIELTRKKEIWGKGGRGERQGG